MTETIKWTFTGNYDLVRGEYNYEVVEGEGDREYEVELELPKYYIIDMFLNYVDEEELKEVWEKGFKELFKYDTREQLREILYQDDNLDKALEHLSKRAETNDVYDYITEYLRDLIPSSEIEEAIYYQEID